MKINTERQLRIIRLVVVAIILKLAGCSALLSKYDGVEFLYGFRDQRSIEDVKTPTNFLVAPKEIWRLKPITKTGWNLYHDSAFYYLSSSIQTTSLTGDNSYIAKSKGIAIPGNARFVYECIVEKRKQYDRRWLTELLDECNSLVNQ